jgi:hypothetical protein
MPETARLRAPVRFAVRVDRRVLQVRMLAK